MSRYTSRRVIKIKKFREIIDKCMYLIERNGFSTTFCVKELNLKILTALVHTPAIEECRSKRIEAINLIDARKSKDGNSKVKL